MMITTERNECHTILGNFYSITTAKDQLAGNACQYHEATSYVQHASIETFTKPLTLSDT
jgi:hypothetical protein